MNTATNKSTTKKDRAPKGFTAEERDAVRARARELKAEERASKNRADGERDVLVAIAAMPGPDRALTERIHALVTVSASPSVWRS
jgi:hypothetical protein